MEIPNDFEMPADIDLDQPVASPKRGRPPGTVKRRGRRIAWAVANIGAMPGNKKVAATLGLVACVLLGLSLVHCTRALMALTGSPILLALAMALGIDVGMIGSEIGVIIGKSKTARVWSGAYLSVSAVLSAILNAAANSFQAPDRYSGIAVVAGVLIPLLVYLLAQATAHLWREAQTPASL